MKHVKPAKRNAKLERRKRLKAVRGSKAYAMFPNAADIQSAQRLALDVSPALLEMMEAMTMNKDAA